MKRLYNIDLFEIPVCFLSRIDSYAYPLPRIHNASYQMCCSLFFYNFRLYDFYK